MDVGLILTNSVTVATVQRLDEPFPMRYEPERFPYFQRGMSLSG